MAIIFIYLFTEFNATVFGNKYYLIISVLTMSFETKNDLNPITSGLEEEVVL